MSIAGNRTGFEPSSPSSGPRSGTSAPVSLARMGEAHEDRHDHGTTRAEPVAVFVSSAPAVGLPMQVPGYLVACATVRHAAALRSVLARTPPAVLVLDEAWCRAQDAASARTLRELAPQVPRLLRGERVSPRTVECLLAWEARGLIAGEASEAHWAAAFRGVRDGELWLPREAARWLYLEAQQARTALEPTVATGRLTPREAQVHGLLRSGLTNPEIALRLAISLSTTKKHVERVYRKIGVQRRRQVLV